MYVTMSMSFWTSTVKLTVKLQATKSEEKQATNYDYTKCPAYVPISHGDGNQQAMTTFIQPSTTTG